MYICIHLCTHLYNYPSAKSLAVRAVPSILYNIILYYSIS